MEEKTALIGERVRRKLERYPPLASGEFQDAWEAMSSKLNDGQLTVWAEAGLELAQQSVRSWEAASQYFKVSPRIVGLMPFNCFVEWSECGRALCQESPALATSYFGASHGAIRRLGARHVETWANLGSSLYKGTWKSGTLASKFFESSARLLQSLTVPELERFVAFLEALSRHSCDVSAECLALGRKVFPMLGDSDSKAAFLALGSTLTQTRWRQVKGLFEAASKALPRIDAGQRLRFLNLMDGLRRSGSPNVPAAMLDVSQALAEVNGQNHARLLELAESLLEVSPTAVPEFIRSCPVALGRVTMGRLEEWFEEGSRVLQKNVDGGIAYFRLESAFSQGVLETLSASVEFTRIKDLMEMYCQALAGADIELAESEELADKNIGWVSEEAPTTEGSTIFVPTLVDRYATKPENFAYLKVISTHQAAHLEFGSFGFEFERQSTLFRDLRPQLSGKALGVESEEVAPEGDDCGAVRGWVTDMQRLFDLLEDRRLALDVFTVVEDGRLDARVKSEYAGIKRDYSKVQHDALAGRPHITSLPMREAMLEFLVRVSLEQYVSLPAPARYVDEARKVAGIAKRVMVVGARVEDTAEAMLRIYAIISRIPNERLGPDDWQNIDVDDDVEGDYTDDAQDLIRQLMQGTGPEPQSEGEQEYQASQNVDYRGDFKPELVQLLERLRMQREAQESDGDAQAITQEMLEELLKNSAELDLGSLQGDMQKISGTFADNMLREAGLNLRDNPESGQGRNANVDEHGGALAPTEPETFVYDEWDFRVGDYKPRWCIVRQKSMAEGDASYYGNTLHSYGSLVQKIRRQFEMMVPEMFRKVRKLEDGEEIDIDDVIEAMIDIRTGVGPSEKLFWRRNKVQRDVAVVFLLDISASTAEAIDNSRREADRWAAPDDPAEYMAWLKTRRGEGMRRSHKRIIDLEKEACVLLTHALEAIGDVYGIYGFSGYGRENVEFYTIKDIDESFSEKVKNRIDRIAPLHATRMGPAIRHATSKLERHEARTKLLFLISDGRPQDRGYSREGVEKEYAVHDTKMALDEAKAKDITAFCLTVDKDGHDYLKTMCQDIGYEILDDIFALPRRLLYLYERLTM